MIRYLLGFFLTKGKTPSALVTSGSNFSVCSSFFKASRNWNVSWIFSCFSSRSGRIASPPRVGATGLLEFLFQFLYRVPKVSCVVGCYQFFLFRTGNHEHKRARRLVCICICTVVCSYPYRRLHSLLFHKTVHAHVFSIDTQVAHITTKVDSVGGYHFLSQLFAGFHIGGFVSVQLHFVHHVLHVGV